MIKDFNFDEIYILQIISMKVIGSHPDVPKNFKWACYFLLKHGLFTTVALFILYSVLFHDLKTDVAIACSNFSVIVVYLYNTCSLFLLLNYQKSIKTLIDTMKQDFEEAKQFPDEEKKTIQTYAECGRWVTKLWAYILLEAGTVFLLKPLIMMMFYYIVGDFKYVQFMDLTYPAAINEYKNSFGIWFLAMINFLHVYVYASMIYTASVPTGPSYILHACGQLELLKMRILQLFPEDGSITPQIREKRLKEIAKKLQGIYEFVNHIQISFKFLYEATLKGTAVILPVLAYTIVDAYRKGKMTMDFNVPLFTGGIAICAIPCYYGDMLIQKSADFREAVYSCRWETCWEKQTRSTILIIMTRTTRTVALQSIFRTICLESLTELYRDSLTLFNLLTAIWG